MIILSKKFGKRKNFTLKIFTIISDKKLKVFHSHICMNEQLPGLKKILSSKNQNSCDDFSPRKLS